MADEKPLNCHCQAGDGVQKHGRLDVLEQQCEAISKSLVATLGEGGARLMLEPLPCLPKGEVYFNRTNAGCCPALDATMGKTVALPALPHVAWWDSGCSQMGWEGLFPPPTAGFTARTGWINSTLLLFNFHENESELLYRFRSALVQTHFNSYNVKYLFWWLIYVLMTTSPLVYLVLI